MAHNKLCYFTESRNFTIVKEKPDGGKMYGAWTFICPFGKWKFILYKKKNLFFTTCIHVEGRMKLFPASNVFSEGKNLVFYGCDFSIEGHKYKITFEVNSLCTDETNIVVVHIDTDGVCTLVRFSGKGDVYVDMWEL